MLFLPPGYGPVVPRVLLIADERFLEHVPGPGHPERPERLGAVLDGIADADLGDDLVVTHPRLATVEELTAVHTGDHVARIEAFCAAGGGHLDPDTAAVPASWTAARLAAGAGLLALERLGEGVADAAFLAVRPPGHHATPNRAMGFCLFNNVAVTAGALAAAGERVLIVDFDAHHGNGTQDAFWSDPRVAYVSLHQWPLYPGTGALAEVGAGAGRGSTVNLPVPAGATGDVYLAAFDEVVVPLAERLEPTWLLLSAGFDAHRADPLTGLGLAAGDYALLTSRLTRLVAPGRVVAFLEGGYDLGALRRSTTACIRALAGADDRAVGGDGEAATSGGPGRDVVAAASLVRTRLADLG
jgi:acetoin utilization deacetylase AcuC-like enzyme